MTFSFQGTADQLVFAITENAIQSGKNFIIDYDQNEKLNIAFKRLGHNSGRWLVGQVSSMDGNTILSGKLETFYQQPPIPQSKRPTIGFQPS